jgi:hypothetical protein
MIGPLLAPFVMCSSGQRAVRLLRPVRPAAGGLSGLAQAAAGPIPLAEHQVFMPVPPNTPMTAELEPRTDLAGEAVPATYARTGWRMWRRSSEAAESLPEDAHKSRLPESALVRRYQAVTASALALPGPHCG